MKKEKIILITGASSGVGEAAAEALSREGHRVYGTTRNLAKLQGERPYQMLALDVGDCGSVKSCVGEVIAREGRLDVVVNNAGFALAGAIEETSLEEGAMQLDTNLFGVSRMVREVLPHMRRQGGGLIVNVSSLSGLMAAPFQGYYAASKFALEGLSEALRQEVRGFGVAVSLVEPGFLNTPFSAARLLAKESSPHYSPNRERVLRSIEEKEARGAGAHLVAQAILRLIQMKNPTFRVRVGGDSKWLPRIRAISPPGFWEKRLRKSFNMAD